MINGISKKHCRCFWLLCTFFVLLFGVKSFQLFQEIRIIRIIKKKKKKTKDTNELQNKRTTSETNAEIYIWLNINDRGTQVLHISDIILYSKQTHIGHFCGERILRQRQWFKKLMLVMIIFTPWTFNFSSIFIFTTAARSSLMYFNKMSKVLWTVGFSLFCF